MESLNNILKKSLNKEFLSAIISNPREKGGIVKIKIRPVEHKDNILYQCEEHRNNQVFHHNLNEEEAAGYIENAMQEFKQMQMETRKFRYQVLVSKKRKMTIQRRLQTGRFKEIDLSHNRKKHYILEEGKAVPFLQDLGVMTKEGEIVRTKFDKFRQINRFLEFIEDVLPELPKDREVTILDFGCGKSYLTFAIYYYLHELKGYDIRIIGLIKERMAALVTDAMRAEYLKREGYDTQILEFIDMEHTPKNILIRAIYTGNKGKNTEAIRTCEEMLHIDPMLGRLLDQQNEEGEKGV
ncbi:methyltransferase [Coprococcus sp. LG101-27]|uniref:methyltransferase n=1 Tax=Coprococcus sp. LG101-27 TaxID=2997954 RepID=UPI0022E2832A|nr:methyltransferase [Coprococcus sp. LG101-27]